MVKHDAPPLTLEALRDPQVQADLNWARKRGLEDYRKAMKEVDKALFQAVPDATADDLNEHCRWVHVKDQKHTVIFYKDRAIVRFGFRNCLTMPGDEFFIEISKGAPFDV